MSSDSCIAFELLDQMVQVESESPEFIAELRNCFEEVLSHPSGDDGSADLYARVALAPGAAEDARARFELTTRPEQALRMMAFRTSGPGWALARELVQWVVDSASGYYVFHAGSVARDGRGILLPGSTHSGKSTLTVALAKRGFDILSDEVGAIRLDDGLQMGFGRALSIRKGVVALLGLDCGLGWTTPQGDATLFRASDLGFSRAATARPALIVMPSYRKHAVLDLRPLRPAAAVLALYEASCSQPRWKVAGLDFVIDLVARVPCFELSYSNMHDAAQAIEKTFSEVCGSATGALQSPDGSAEEEECSP